MGSRIVDLEKSVTELVSETVKDEDFDDEEAKIRAISRVGSQLSRQIGTFANQDKVPRLPIPPLSQTAEKYLKSCKPLLSPTDFETTKVAVAEFVKPGGYGEVLQARLHEVDKNAPNSWLEDIWLKKAYLEWREPSMINVNWWCQFRDHPNHPKDLLTKPLPKGQLTPFQLERASGFITRLLEFKTLIESEKLEPEMMKDKPLCMNQYRFQFGITRVPGETCDTIYSEFPAVGRHIIVIVRDQIYTLEVLKENGEAVPRADILKTLAAIDADSKGTTTQPPIGVLTAGHRDTWFKAFKHLTEINSANVESFEKIKTALFAVCLDDTAISSDIDITHQQLFHNFNAHNRWFDKAISLVVLPNGRAGVNGEHTPSDAVIPGNIMNYIVASEKSDGPLSTPGHTIPFSKLEWQVDASIAKSIEQAQKEASALIGDTYSVLLQTDMYGSQFIKDKAKASPDAYVQLALQLTWRRLHTEPTAIYESASTRLFKHGRTETGRSLTEDTWKFASQFDSADKETVINLFRAAIKSQSDYMKDATFGKGVDRHLLGLRTLIRDGETPKATLFTDPAYIKSMYFKLSSSNMSPGTYFYGGFGPVVPEGYGVNYSIGKTDLKFSISAKKSCPDTDPRKFRDTLDKSLRDLGNLF
ncbi:hypothetical protein HDU97_004876 [Phlyctochytrium planicorne]|nr:hypothetical protein HDU97_004876 [Phlyctochytrium planicorne]